MADAQVLVDHLDHRRQAVGGAGGSGDDAVQGRVEQVLVDAHDDIQRAGFLDRGADHHALDPLFQVARKHSNRLHLAAGLDHQVAARPVGVGDGLVGADPDPLAVDQDAVARAARLMLPAAVHRVEIQQVGMGRRIAGRVVDLHEFELRPVPGGA
ncbi:hypothetical protein D3C84_930780 [compost metagenome]